MSTVRSSADAPEADDPVTRGGSPRPIDRLVGGYLLLSAAAVLAPGRAEGALLLLLAHLGAAVFLFLGGPARLRERLTRPGPGDRGGASPPATRGGSALRRAAAGLVDWYPLLLMPVLYWEIPLLNQALWGGTYFDAVILRWEEAMFGGQPSATLAARWSWLPLSELLHGAYLAYYPVIYFFPAFLYLRGRRAAFDATLFALMLGFAAHYLVFTTFPVQGPRYLFPAPGGALAEGFLYGVTHSVLEAGSSQGAAFPSSHAAIAAIQTVNAFRFLPRAAPLLGLLTAGIGLGAVYGGFHYGIDIVVGLVTGVGLAVAAPAIRRLLA